MYLRRGNGICTKIIMDSCSSPVLLYRCASELLKMNINNFVLYHQGNSIDKSETSSSLISIDLKPNSIVDVIEIDN